MRGTAAILAACAVLALSSCGTASRERVTLNVVPNQPDTRIVVDADAERADIQIFSPRGIGGADAKFTSAALPRRVVMRFHLRGLEELRFTYGGITVTASLASVGGALRQSRGTATGGAQE